MRAEGKSDDGKPEAARPELIEPELGESTSERVRTAVLDTAGHHDRGFEFNPDVVQSSRR
jgi:hypothetical protein